MPSPAMVALLASRRSPPAWSTRSRGGGGLVTLPALLAAGLPPHVALATNKGQAVFGATASALSFWRRGAVDRDRARARVRRRVRRVVLGAWRACWPCRSRPLRVVVIVLLLVRRRDPARAPRADAARPARRPARAARRAASPSRSLLGAYDGFFGPGTGSLLVIAFAIVFGDPLTRASGNAKIVNLASNLAAMLLFASRGAIRWPPHGRRQRARRHPARARDENGDRLVRAVVLLVVLAVVVKLAVDLR